MRQTKYRWVVVMAFCVALLPMLVGCSERTSRGQMNRQSGNMATESNGDIVAEEEFYVAEPLQAPNGMVPGIVRMRDTVLYTYDSLNQDELEYNIIYASDMEGTVTHSYMVPVESGYIVDFYPDDNGLWVVTVKYTETNRLEIYDSCTLLHFRDEANVQMATIDIQHDVEKQTTPPLSLVVDDNRGCIYLFGQDYFSAYDQTGMQIFTMGTDGYLYHACFTKDGRLAVCDTGNDSIQIRIFDYDNRAWAESYTLNIPYRKMFGGLDYDLYVSDGQTLYGVELEEETETPVFQWLDVGIGNDLFACFALGESEYIAASDSGLFKILPSSESVEKTVLTMATFNYDIAAREALAFNETQDNYKIVVKDYSNYNTDENDSAGLEKLGLDIVSGDAPDIYDLCDIPVSQYVHMGLLENLYTYLDSDKTLSRADYSEALLSAMEIDGGLYSLMPHVSVMTLMADPENIDKTIPWSFDAMLALSGGVDPFGGDMDRYTFIECMLAGKDSPFVDWQEGSCSFDSEELVGLLEFSKLLPAAQREADMEHPELYTENLEPRTLVYQAVGEFGSVLYATIKLDCYDESGNTCAAAIGLPGKNSARYLLYPATVSWGMSSSSENKDGVWCFMRSYLEQEYQRTNSIPLSKNAFSALENDYENWLAQGGIFGTLVLGKEVELSVSSTIYMERVQDVANSATGVYERNPALMQIIMDEAAAFFAGDKTAEQTAANIQSRVSIYMAEQG